MDNNFDKVQKMTNLWMSAITGLIYALLLIGYQKCIVELQKPAGFVEALTFFFRRPSDYFAALLMGVLLHAICLIVVVICILYFIGVVADRFDITPVFIINIVMSITMSILNMYYAKYVMSLVLVVFAIGVVAWLWANDGR